MPDRYDDDRDDDRPRGRGRDRDDRPRRRDDRDDDSDDDFDPRPRRAAQVPEKSNAGGLAVSIIALILGTGALLFSFINCIGYYAIYPGALAIVLSALGLILSVRSKGLPAVALVVSVASVGIAYWQGTKIDALKIEAEKAGKQIISDAEKRIKEAEDRQREQERLAKEKADAEKKKKANPDD